MTREKILETAAQIFSEKGFHAASMQDIASAVNLQKASLYHHVSSKQEILLELLDRALDILIERIGDVVAKPDPPEVKLVEAMQVYLQILTSQRGLSAVLLFEHRSLDPELQSSHIPRRDRFESLWRVLIQEGIEAGAFADVDAAQAARTLLGVMNWTLTWYRSEGPQTIEDITDQYANLFLNGLFLRN
jgi:AcrR family transcriptional regulator